MTKPDPHTDTPDGTPNTLDEMREIIMHDLEQWAMTRLLPLLLQRLAEKFNILGGGLSFQAGQADDPAALKMRQLIRAELGAALQELATETPPSA